jgi:hypothetical protein
MRIVIAGSEFPLMGKKIPMCVVRHRKKARPSNIIRRCAGMIAPSRSSWPAHSTAGFLTPFAHLRQCRDIRRQQPPEANRLVHALRARSLRLIAHRNVVSAKSCAPLQRLRERPTSRLHAASNLSGRTFVFFGQPDSSLRKRSFQPFLSRAGSFAVLHPNKFKKLHNSVLTIGFKIAFQFGLFQGCLSRINSLSAFEIRCQGYQSVC